MADCVDTDQTPHSVALSESKLFAQAVCPKGKYGTYCISDKGDRYENMPIQIY